MPPANHSSVALDQKVTKHMDTIIQRDPLPPEAEAVSVELRKLWAEQDLIPLWESTNGAVGQSAERPRHWQWERLRPIMLETAKIKLPSIVERRVLQLVNKSIVSGPAEAATGLMNATIQALMPGELARAHRHSMNALRLVLEGQGAETVVNDKPCAMVVGDLITTPAWTWHEHRHHGSVPVIWLDILDAGLHVALGEARFEPGPIRGAARAIADTLFTAPCILPALEATWEAPYSPVFRYPWADAVRALAAAPTGPDNARHVRYVNPLTGGPCMALIDCQVAEIAGGTRTVAFRTSASSICSVVEGEGTSQIGDTRVSWRQKDVFTVPAHTWVSHEAQNGVARIFMAQNSEVYRRLGLLAEELRISDEAGRA